MTGITTTKGSTITHRIGAGVLLLALPLLGGARGDGCAANSTSPAPNVVGDWSIEYDNTLDVEVTIGGATYTESLGVNGGIFSITHDGQPLMFDLDCARPEIVCPSEAWPTQIEAEQRNERFEHRMIVTLPTQTCAGQVVAANPAECGADTPNPDCDDVCDGEISVTEQERFGVIGETGESFRLFLGAGIASNGFNCALLGVSFADADLLTAGGPDEASWEAEEMASGLVTVAFAGGCLFAGNVDMDPGLEALLVGASIKFTTGFTGTRL